MLSCHVLLLSHVVATAAARKTPPTGTRGLCRGVGLALFLSPQALSKGNTETQGDGAATNHQSRSRATLKRETTYMSAGKLGFWAGEGSGHFAVCVCVCGWGRCVMHHRGPCDSSGLIESIGPVDMFLQESRFTLLTVFLPPSPTERHSSACMSVTMCFTLRVLFDFS